jgi:cell division protein FtsZ
MIQFDFVPKATTIIKVIGVGGGGGNAVSYMHSLGIDGVDFILANTDQKALATSNVPTKLQLGPALTSGLGAGANPEVGQRASEESAAEITNILKENTKMVFITAGMGGGTGTGAAPVIAKIAKDLGILTVGIVTTPFSHEGIRRRKQAEEGIEKMRQNVDTILVISNDKMRHAFGNLPFTQAFSKADNVLATAAKCITDVINSHGHMGIDFADVSTVMKDGGVAIMGSASSSGPDRAREAVQLAIDSPLLNDSQIKGAKWVLVNINSASGEFEQTVDEIDAIQAFIQQEAGEGCDVILGVGLDETLVEAINVTIIATGFNRKDTLAAYDKSSIEKPAEEKIVVSLDAKHSASNTNSNPNASVEIENLIPQEINRVTENPLVEELKMNQDGIIIHQLQPVQEIKTSEVITPNIINATVPQEVISEKSVPGQITQEFNKQVFADLNSVSIEDLQPITVQENVTAPVMEIETPLISIGTEVVLEEAKVPVLETIPTPIVPAMFGMGFRPKPTSVAETIHQVQPIVTSQVQDSKIVFELNPEITTELPKQEEQISPSENGLKAHLAEESEIVVIQGITVNIRRGSRLMTEEEIQDYVAFELHKQSIYNRADDRANNLRRMNFNTVPSNNFNTDIGISRASAPYSNINEDTEMSNIQVEADNNVSTIASFTTKNNPC